MKKNKVLFIVLALIFISCSRETEDVSLTETKKTASIVGTWSSQPLNYVSTFDGTVLGTPIDDGPIQVSSPSQDYKITFSDNQNQISSTGVFSLSVTALGVKLPDVNDFDFPLNGSWLQTGNEVSIVSQGEVVKATIIELSESTLKLSFNPADFDIQQYIGTAYITDLVLKDNIVISFLRVTM